MDPKSKDELDNRAKQLNPNNDAYWQSRGEGGRQDDLDDDDYGCKSTDASNDDDVDWREWDSMSENDWEFNDD